MKLKVFLTVLSMFGLSLMFNQTSHAVSQFDTFIRYDNQSILLDFNRSFYTCIPEPKINWTTDWQDLMNDQEYWTFGDTGSKFQEYHDAFNQAKAHGSYVVYSYWNNFQSSDGTTVYVAYSPSKMELKWTENQVGVVAKDTTDVYYVSFQVIGSRCKISAWPAGRSSIMSFGVPDNTTSTSGRYYYHYSKNLDTQLPDGYEGVIPADFEPYIPPDNSESLDFKYIINDKNMKLQSTTESPPIKENTMCMFAYSVKMEDGSESTGQIGEQSHETCTDEINFDVFEYGDYKITFSTFDDLNNDGIYNQIEENTGNKTKEVKVDGGIHDSTTQSFNDLMAECINDQAPFIHLDKCTQVAGKLLSMMTFNKSYFGTQWTTNDECRNLVVLGNWIGVGHKTICPMFPQSIRNIVSPFVTLLLGLIILKFITSNAGRGVY